MVYGDNEVSMEEKRAKNPKYASLVPATVANQAPSAAGAVANGAETSAQVAAGAKRARATDFL